MKHIKAASFSGISMKPFHRNQGFTLIEVIITLMLVGILATVAGAGIVEVARGYQAARENDRMAQTARIALLRINRELMELESVSYADNSAISVVTPSGQTTIARFGTDILLDDDADATDGEVLIDRVASFQITYQDMDNQPWTGTMPMDQLAGITLQLILSRSDGKDPITFSTRISPRNNGAYHAPH